MKPAVIAAWLGHASAAFTLPIWLCSRMALARKVVLRSEVSDQAALAPFVEQCIQDGVSLLAIVGPGAAELENTIDGLIVGDGSDPNRFICTTSHPDDVFGDVVNMVELWEPERSDFYQVVHL